jgi:choice-of-anchor C domain-containing protein
MLLRSLFVGLASALVVSGSASAATIVNGGFEQPGTFNGNFQTLSAGSTNLTGWTIDSGSIDLINAYWTPSEGSYSIDLDGSSVGSISQLIMDLTIGQSYTILFDLAGNPDGNPIVKTLEVSAGGTSAQYTFDKSGKTRANMGWETTSFVFTAQGTSETLRFASLTGGSVFGPALDNVRFSSVAPDVVPLPAAGWLLLGGMGALVALRRNKRA